MEDVVAGFLFGIFVALLLLAIRAAHRAPHGAGIGRQLAADPRVHLMWLAPSE